MNLVKIRLKFKYCQAKKLIPFVMVDLPNGNVGLQNGSNEYPFSIITRPLFSKSILPASAISAYGGIPMVPDFPP